MTTDRPPARVFVGVRLGAAALATLDDLARAAGTTRSSMLRTLLRLGLAAYRAGAR